MNDKKIRLSLTGAIVILSICILISASNISSAIRYLGDNTANNNNDYQLSRFNDNFDELIKALKEKHEDISR
ncbi:hypothetical protein F7731_16065 [Cytobacillus depressus]|uniref:Methyl-accepting chemotaxis protein n=1 Tax=Cytobacillus depressus TaxID=1602942 RepID=A0A6L3V5D0_9BACI|nr:hypothetical protein [Cytobacillus depressus]KAB2333367.1 hypothetical protein F7731_16065 [Cytobacillus depressus]